MRIACPSCHAEYEVPDAMLAAGPRQLRCARCAHAFPAALPAAVAPRSPQVSPRPAPPPLPEPPLPEPSLAEPPWAEPDRPASPPASGEGAGHPPAQPDPATDSIPAPITGPDRPPPTRGPLHHSPIDPPEDTPTPTNGRLAAAWLGSLALLGAGGVAVMMFQAEIVAAWPPAARFYALLGLG